MPVNEDFIRKTRNDTTTDATQVFEDATMEIEEPKTIDKKARKKEKGQVEVNVDPEASTKVFDDATLAVEETQAINVESDKLQTTRKSKMETEAATQVFDETLPVCEIDGAEPENEPEVATQVFDEVVEATRKEPTKREKTVAPKRGRPKRGKKEIEEVPNRLAAESETLVESEVVSKDDTASDIKDEVIEKVETNSARTSRRKKQQPVESKLVETTVPRRGRLAKKEVDNIETKSKDIDKAEVTQPDTSKVETGSRGGGQRDKKTEPESVKINKKMKTKQGTNKPKGPVKKVDTEAATQVYAEESDNEGELFKLRLIVLLNGE